MDFKEWFLGLTNEQRDEYARRAGTTAGYIRVHLIGRRKIPRAEFMKRLADASGGAHTVPSLLAFFYRTRESALEEADRALAGAHPQQAAYNPRRAQMR